MAITNLTNTTWYVLSGWDFGSFNTYRTFSINGSTDEGTFDSIRFDPDEEFQMMFYHNVSFSNGFYRSEPSTFSILGGTDVTNPDLIKWLTTYGTQLKVTDLTNTTWTVNAGWEAEAGYGDFDINGSFLGNESVSRISIGYSKLNFTTVSPSANILTYAVGGRFTEDVAFNTSLTATFTGGADVTNPKLIAWLSKYGELKVEEEGEAPPDDLTGYTVTLPSSLLMFENVVYVEGDINFNYSEGSSSVGFTALGYGNPLYAISYIADGYSSFNGEFYIKPDLDLYYADALYGTAVSMTFTGGDTTNSSLIQWLVDNDAIFTKEDEEEDKTPILTYDLSQLNLPAGTHLITVIAKANGYTDSAPSNVVEYVVEETGVVIPAGTYEANFISGILNYNGTQPLNFICNSVSYISMSVATQRIRYISDNSLLTAYDFSGAFDIMGWQNTAYKTITLDTDQTVTTEFGEWFNTNFTKKAEPPTNLTNYTVTVPENWSVESGYGTFDIEAKQIFDGGSYQFETIILGDIENDVIFLQKNITGLGKTLDDTSTPIVLEIWGGNDAANSQLIQWFVDNKATFTKNHSGGL